MAMGEPYYKRRAYLPYDDRLQFPNRPDFLTLDPRNDRVRKSGVRDEHMQCRSSKRDSSGCECDPSAVFGEVADFAGIGVISGGNPGKVVIQEGRARIAAG